MRGSTQALAALTLSAPILLATCTEQHVGVRPVVPAAGPSLTQASAAAPSEAASAPPVAEPISGPALKPSEVSFHEAPTIQFSAGATLKPKKLADRTAIYALSPDTKSWVIDGPNNTALLITPAFPKGISHSVWVPSAVFSDDGSKVLIWSTSDLVVLDVATGRTLAKHTGDICAARFSGASTIVFHESSKDEKARFWRWALDAPAPTALGALRDAEYCYASNDGASWLVESYDKRWYLDGRTGAVRPLAPPAKGATLSGAGNRSCIGSSAGLVCVRHTDERTERVWSRPTSERIVFESSGSHAMVTFAESSDGVYSSFALVDFETLTVRRLRGAKAQSGSLFALSPGAKLLTIGSRSGLYPYDLERAKVRFAAHSPLFGNFVFPHHPRVLVAGTDEPMDLFLVDVR